MGRSTAELHACRGQRNQPPPGGPFPQRPARAASSSPGRPGRTTAATRRCAATCTKACRSSRRRPGPGTPRRRCGPWSGTSGPGRPGSSSTPAPARPGHRPRTPPGRRSSSCAGPGIRRKQISEALAGTPTPLNRTGVAQVINEAGLGRLPVRPAAAQRATVPGPPTPRRAARHHRTPGPIRHQDGRAAADPARPGRPGPARHGRRRRLPRHHASSPR